MPRDCPNGLLTSPTQCLALRVDRKDGTIYGFSTSPVPFSYGGVLFQAGQGADIANIESQAGTSVDNTEAKTLLSASAAYLAEADVVGMRFEGSRWTVLLIDYLNPGNGAMVVARYRLQRTRFTETSMTFELRGLLSLLKTVTGHTYEPMCDVDRFGDLRCDPHQTILMAQSDVLAVTSVIDRFNVDFENSARAVDFYADGRAIWLTGVNAGTTTPVKFHTKVGGKTRIRWKTPPAFAPRVGDTARLVFGCDRRKATCMTVPNPNNPSGKNVENAKLFYSPTTDELLVIAKPS